MGALTAMDALTGRRAPNRIIAVVKIYAYRKLAIGSI